MVDLTPATSAPRGTSAAPRPPNAPPRPLATPVDFRPPDALRPPRLTREEARALWADDVLTLGERADAVRARLHPDNIVTFIVDRNVNYTNVCDTYCTYCAFYRKPGHADGYVLPLDAIYAKLEELVAQGGTQVLLQGGHNPDLRIGYYEDLFRAIKKRFDITLHALSAPEICYIADLEQMSVRETLERLVEAGLDSLPGGGAEMLPARVRMTISPLKIAWERWADAHRVAHTLGLSSTATMVTGFGETVDDILDHLTILRDIQDDTHGFTAFITWTYQQDNTPLQKKHIPRVTAVEHLKTLAFSRLFLDNFMNLQASWVTQGPKIGQLSLRFGANDMGGTMLEENVVSAAGTTYGLTREECIALIREAGFTPAQRTTRYDILETCAA